MAVAYTTALFAVALLCSGVSSISFDAMAAKNRPVSKVITLLKDMLKQMEKEGEEDEEIYDKVACWCETNDKEKTKAIADAESMITDLTSKIEEYTAMVARLTTEIKNHKEELAKLNGSLEKATAIRQKELAEFNAEEKDMLESISALKSALVVLSKHHGDSLVQVPHAQRAEVVATLQHELEKHASLLKGVLTHEQRRAVTAFIASPYDDYVKPITSLVDSQQESGAPSYSPQSGQVYGILKQMLETFASNLSDSQKEEMAKQQGYEELKVALEAEITAAQSQVDTKVQELAVNEEKLSQSKEDLEDFRHQLSADQKFLMMLKEKCQMTDQEWEERQKARQLEMEAVSKALSILSSDDAHDTFSKTFNPALLQTSNLKALAQKASDFLRSAARQLQSPRLATLSLRVRLDAFAKVKQAIDNMITELMKQQADEVKHKDFCVSEFNENQLTTEKKEREKTDVEAKIEDLKMTIKAIGEEIETLKAEIAEMRLQLKRAGEDREVENKEFQMTVADQRATQKLLAQALTVLKGFYEKGAALVQVSLDQDQEPAGPPPPPGFKPLKSQAASGGVMGLIQQIINDAKAMEADAIRSEEDAQKAYEDFTKDTNNSIAKRADAIVDKTENKSKAEQDLVEAEESQANIMLELEQLSNYNSQLHSECDFVVKNFDLRQSAREEEIDALKQAKAILSGAKFNAFLQ